MRCYFLGGNRRVCQWLFRRWQKGLRQKKRENGIDTQRYRQTVGKVGPCRIDDTVGEVEETDGLINDREAEGYQGINTASNNTVK